MSNSSNKTIAKNSVYLYLRMFATMGISLYSSRLILDALGVEDYGIYNVVGGIVAMFAFINTTLAGATSRFINYEMGKESGNTQEVFSTALTVHIIIALSVLLIGETFGNWFLYNKMVLPEGRLGAAELILQFSLVTMLFNFTQVPYNASIIAHEKMKVYAYVGLIDALLKLAIIIGVSYCGYDKLILYGFLIMLEQVSITLYYRFYCMSHFNSCRFIVRIHKTYLKPMLTYSVWDIFGQGSLAVRSQGVSMLLNVFFGAAINAATGIASHINAVVLQFAGGITTAVRPQIVKSFARGDYSRMDYLINFGAKITFLMMVIVGVPTILEMDLILDIWLKEVPDQCVEISRLTFLACVLGILANYPMIGIDATAKIRDTSLILGILYLMVVPVSYIIFRLDMLNPVIPYIYNAITPLLAVLINSYFLHRYVKDFNLRKYILRTALPAYAVFIVTFMILYYEHITLMEGFMRFIVMLCSSAICTGVVGFFSCFDTMERNSIRNLIIKKIRK